VYGSASGTIVSSGGHENVESGGTGSNTVVSSSGSLVVLSGGLADPATIYSGGSETIRAGATDDGAHISGGTQFDYGLASGVTIFTGSQVVSSGGTAVHDTISGGTVVLETGAVASGGITFASSGTLEVFGSAMPSATISGFTSGDIIDLAAIASGAGGRAVLASGNVLDVLEGGSTYALQLNPSQSFSGDQFVVTSDGSGGTDVTVVPFSATVSSGTLPVSAIAATPSMS
jgi:autotransporter passenger strand-loop-strand repeat protein